MVRTLKAFTVFLYTVLGANNPLSMTFKREIVDQYDNFQPAIEMYVASLPGQLSTLKCYGGSSSGAMPTGAP
jgi:hypothetical protein